MTPTRPIVIVLMSFLLLGTTPVSAQQGLGPEILISELDNEQHQPHVAYNSLRDQYLVVWHNVWGGDRDIYGRRLDGQGNVLSWFAISSGAVDRAQPAVTYDPINDRYLVVWAHDFNGDGSDWDLYGRLIPWNGPDAGLTEFPIESSSRSQGPPEVAFALTQREFFVVWSSSGSGLPMDIEGRRVLLDGTFPPASGIAVASGANDRTNPDIAYNLDRNEYLVTYDELGADILATRLNGDGVILGAGEFGIASWPSPESRPSIAACGGGTDQYFVAWQSLVGAGNNDVYGRFVTGDGVPDGAPIHFYSTVVSEQNPNVTCGTGPAEYMVLYETQYSSTTGPFGIHGQLVPTSGSLPPYFVVRGPIAGETGVCFAPTVAAGEAGFLVAWEHERQGTSYQDIHGMMVWGPMFYDGFESADTGAWSSTVP